MRHITHQYAWSIDRNRTSLQDAAWAIFTPSAVNGVMTTQPNGYLADALRYGSGMMASQFAVVSFVDPSIIAGKSFWSAPLSLPLNQLAWRWSVRVCASRGWPCGLVRKESMVRIWSRFAQIGPDNVVGMVNIVDMPSPIYNANQQFRTGYGNGTFSFELPEGNPARPPLHIQAKG